MRNSGAAARLAVPMEAICSFSSAEVDAFAARGLTYHDVAAAAAVWARNSLRVGLRAIDRLPPSASRVAKFYLERSRIQRSLNRIRPLPPECSCKAITPSVAPGEGFVKSINCRPLRTVT